MNRFTLSSLDISLSDFLSAFRNPSESICLRAFDDKKRGIFKGMNFTTTFEKLPSLTATLKAHNAEEHGLYLIVNAGGHNDGSITRITAQFVECDGLPFDEQLAQISAFPLEPSIIVKTKRSLHTYWLIDNGEISEFRPIQQALVAHFGGDPMCVNESRVMRLPGFNHCKAEPVPVECVKFNPELRYTQAQFHECLTIVYEAKTLSAKAMLQEKHFDFDNKYGLLIVRNCCEFLRHCSDEVESLSEYDWYAMITNLAVFSGGNAVIHELSEGYPSYSHDETEEKIAHFLSSGTKPITCATIAEKGFKCPKLLDGSCKCKAPAALCTVPPSTDDLRRCLLDMPVSESTLTNIETAVAFIREYLYSTDPTLAGAFIEYEIKERFGFKATDIRPLISQQKEVYKAYAQTPKQAQSDSDIPQWYEITERGGLRFLPGVLAEHLSKNVEAFYCAEQYYVYENGVYNAASDLAARSIARKRMLPKHATLSNITDTEGQWRMLCSKPVTELNPDPYTINVRNGLYNVISGTLTPHNPEYMSTVQLGVKYTPGAECSRFRAFLSESVGEGEVALIQEMLGYFLIPVNSAQKCFVIVGEPGAGKSQLLLTLNEILLGQANVSNVPWQSLNERFKTAELFGKLANIFADLPTKNIDDNGMFKALVGEDFITAERKNKDPFTFKPTARLLFSCNNIPRNYGDKSEGFYRRLIIIRFAHSVPQERRDYRLLDKFRDEADGIFLFAVDGLKRLIDNGFRFSETPSTKRELDRYRIDSNSVLSFADDCCEVNVDAEVPRDEMFDRYREYCKNAGMSPVSQKNFNRDIEAAYPQVRRAVDKLGKRRTWRGISIQEQ